MIGWFAALGALRWRRHFHRPLSLGLAGLIIAIGLGSPRPADAREGETVAVVQRAVIRADGTTETLDVGQPVRTGDIIATGTAGQAQILFPDTTRIVVGPNSQVEIDRMLFRENNTARRLTVTAVRGSFRFLSGQSPSRAYRLRTPTATMGVRGTSFDVAVGDEEETSLVVYTGRVEICARGRCANVPGGCQNVAVNRRGEFSQPATIGERSERLLKFPFVHDQNALRNNFRASTANCDDGDGSRTILARPVKQIRLPSTQAADTGGSGAAAPKRSGNPAQ